MTRWARVGNSQKHQKLPEDATPWENFWQNKNQSFEDKTSRNKVKSGRVEKKKQKKKIMLMNNNEEIEGNQNLSTHSSKNELNENQESVGRSIKGLSKKQLKKAKLLLSKIAETNESHQTLPEYSSINEEQESDSGSTKRLSKKQLKKAKLLQSKISETNESQQSFSEYSSIKEEQESDSGSTKRLSKKQLKKAKLLQSNIAESNESHQTSMNEEPNSTKSQGLSKRQFKKAKLLQSKIAQSNDEQDLNSSNIVENIEVSETNSKSPKEKDFQGKKKLYMQKLEMRRKKNGILLLPPKVERRLYIIKKRLREKGLPPEAIRQIARKERRKEELKFRGSISNKPCFNCRQIGHLLAECPMKLGKTNQETGICFKCGSAEHTSYKCPENIDGYPLAKCFVCKEQGHISKDCPKNEHGVYIKGGKCSLCGNVNHLKKDCPTLKKKHAEEVDITAYTINDGKSVDAEIIPTDDMGTAEKTKIKKEKNAKVVKF